MNDIAKDLANLPPRLLVLLAYRLLLGRSPENAEVIDRHLVATGGDLELLRRNIMLSAEFRSQRKEERPSRSTEAEPMPPNLLAPMLTIKPADHIEWFHQFAFPDGEVVGGKHRLLKNLKAEADIVFRHGVAGMTVLDVGAWDGWNSFEAERRGAARVLATDHFCWSGPGWGTKAGFEYAHCKLGSKVESLDVDVFSLDPTELGTFNIVLFLGVLYHLEDPFGGLKKAATMSSDQIVVDTETALDDLEAPVMRFFLGSELNSDTTNFWAPNKACLRNMLRDLGFTRFEFHDHPEFSIQTHERGRQIVHAWR
jgi:tRNA (mo5U34)-methyltransferase